MAAHHAGDIPLATEEKREQRLKLLEAALPVRQTLADKQQQQQLALRMEKLRITGLL